VCAGVNPGEIVIFDRAYVDFVHLGALNDGGVVWVTRSKEPPTFPAPINPILTHYSVPYGPAYEQRLMPPSLLQLIHSLPLDLVDWYRNRNRNQSGERTVALVVISLVVILALPITALPIAIATAAVIAIGTAVIIPAGALISSVTTVVSSTGLGRSNTYYC
jgi:hypothetical protein